MNRGGRLEPTPPECALAAEMFDHFCSAGTMKQILALHREICNALTLRPNRLPDFYPKLKAKLASSWKAQALFKKFDARASHKVYGKGRMCPATKVLIIGAGPCGLRAAIECQLLGAKVVVIEKRDRMSRNNVLHLWPFVIQDLRALGAKKFFGKFCAGSIDHICIRQLQCILLKVALLLGVEFHEGVSFEELLEPTVMENSEILGWRARVSPMDHPVSQYEFDALLGADGKRNTLRGFKRKEFRGKLAMAITANFINRHTEQEASVPEISGVAFIFNQKFFKDLYEMTGIDLENIVYYKDDTHYFVMTAKKHSLLDKGVLLNDYGEVSRLLSVENVDRNALMRYAQEAARFSTDGRMPLRDFALNHYGEPDVALFDFTSMYAAENASMVYERFGRRLLCQLVGDSLLEPFWPTGSGCARGFLSALDAVWAIRSWGQNPPPHPLEVIAERESIYRLLAQTTPENIHRDFGAYTLDPGTRYPNLNRSAVSMHRVTSFYDSDEPLPLDASSSVRKRRREADVSDEALVAWVGSPELTLRGAASPASLAALLRRYRPDLLPADSPPVPIYHVLHHEFGIAPFSPCETTRDVPDSKLRSYLARVYNAFKGEVPHIHHETDVFDQIKASQLREKHIRNTSEHPVSVYTNSLDVDKSHSSCRKKRRSLRNSQVSTDPAEYIRKEIEKLDLNKIAQLRECLEGRDTLTDPDIHADRQKEIQDQILALFDPDESPDPKLVRHSLTQLIQGTTTTHVNKDQSQLAQFFRTAKDKPTKPRRKLKGMEASAIRAPPNFPVYDDSADTDATVVHKDSALSRSPSTESRKLRSSEKQERNSEGLKGGIKRSGSNGSQKKPAHTKRIVQIFEHNKRRHSIDPTTSRTATRPGINPDMAQRLERMTEMIEGKRRNSVGSERLKTDKVEMAPRRQKVADMVQGYKPRKTHCEGRSMGRRKAAREIMKQRYERSLQMLAAEPRLDYVQSADLENDYGLQQYRADAPDFDERVKKLEKKLQHYEEGRIVGGGARAAGGGARVARLAAELSGSGATPAAPRAPSKPKDLMRSVGKIERDDWNMKEIERKIQENRLGRPEPRTAEKVPKWDREQFLGRQRRLKEGEGTEKWVEIDETLQKLNQKLRDSGRPDHGTKKVANLATKFVKKDEPEPQKQQAKDEMKRGWRGPASTGMQCAACGTRVFAAEGVTADGLHLHRACFRCAVCKAVLRPGNYTMERYGSRLVCLRHSGANVPDAVAAVTSLTAPQPTRSQAPTPTPERISLELSDSGAREIDEDEWTDRNFLASETSGAGGLSDEEESSSDEYTDADDSENEVENSPEPQGLPESRQPRSDLYFSDDSFGYDDYSDDGAESSGNESCSRMRAAREARRREVPADNRLPTDSSEVESEEESESSDEEVSSATEVSTDSEFAREEGLPAQAPPAILVTEPMPPAPTLRPEYPLTRTRSASGLATKRALELKRKYLLGEPSPPTVRKSDSTSQMDTKFEAFRTNITEFQKLLNPAPLTPLVQKPVVTFQVAEDVKKPMPDIIKNLCDDAPVDLLTKGDSPLCKDWRLDTKEDVKEDDVESDSLSDESSHTETAPNQTVPRVEVHDEGGELVQLDSLTIVTSSIEDSEVALRKLLGSDPTVIAAESESSESGRDATTMALTETELSDWAVESVALDDCGFDDKEERKRSKNPRQLSGPKFIHDAKDVPALASHVCGRTSPSEPVKYSNAEDHFEFADEGEQDPAIDRPAMPKNLGYMELVDDEYDYSPSNDRSMNFIERSYSETVLKPTRKEEFISIAPTASEADTVTAKSPSDKNDHITSKMEDLSISETSPPLEEVDKAAYIDLTSPPVIQKATKSTANLSSPTYVPLEKVDKYECIGLKSRPLMIKTTKSIEDVSKTTALMASPSGNVTTKSMEIPQSLTSPLKEIDKVGCIDLTTPSLTHSKLKSTEISRSSMSPPLEELDNNEYIDLHNKTTLPIAASCSPKAFNGTMSLRIYSPAICRSASETFHRPTSHNTLSPTHSNNSSIRDLSSWSTSLCSPTPACDTTNKVQELKREREEQTELVRRLVLEKLGNGPKANKKSVRRVRVSPPDVTPPPVPPPPVLEATPPRPAPPLVQVAPSFSDPELTTERRRKGIMRSITSYFNRRLGQRQKEPQRISNCHKSTGALQEAPPVPPPPVHYTPPRESRQKPPRPPGPVCEADERDAMQLWFEARWARLLAQRRARDARQSPDEGASRRVARLERRLSRPLSAEQQAAAVAELVQISAQRDARSAFMSADWRRGARDSYLGD